MTFTRTGSCVPTGGGGFAGSTLYACTTMLPGAAEPWYRTFPLMRPPGRTAVATSIFVACDGTCAPREFGTVHTWPVFWMTTSWYEPGGTDAMGSNAGA